MDNSFAFRLRKGRLTKEITQEELARRCGVTRQQIRRWERAEAWPRLDHAIRCAAAVGISLDLMSPETQFEIEMPETAVSA